MTLELALDHWADQFYVASTPRRQTVCVCVRMSQKAWCSGKRCGVIYDMHVCVLPPNINTNQKPKEVDIWGGPYMYICIYKKCTRTSHVSFAE